MPRTGWRNISIPKTLVDDIRRHIRAGRSLARNPSDFVSAQLDQAFYVLSRGGWLCQDYLFDPWLAMNHVGIPDWKRRRIALADGVPENYFLRRRGPAEPVAIPEKTLAAFDKFWDRLTPVTEISIVVEVVVKTHLLKLKVLEDEERKPGSRQIPSELWRSDFEETLARLKASSELKKRSGVDVLAGDAESRIAERLLRQEPRIDMEVLEGLLEAGKRDGELQDVVHGRNVKVLTKALQRLREEGVIQSGLTQDLRERRHSLTPFGRLVLSKFYEMNAPN